MEPKSFLIKVRRWQFALGCLIASFGILFVAYHTILSPIDSGLQLAPIRAQILSLRRDPRPNPKLSTQFDRNALAALKSFEDKMDSLKTDSSGCKLYHSIIRAHPGILDSAKQAEEYLHVQSALK
jgi:hypothetical protein